MADKNYIYEQVEAYLNGELSGNELTDFETLLHTDTTLQNQLKVAKAAQKLVMQHRLLQVKALANEEFSRIENKGNNFNKYLIGGSLGVAAVISGLLLFPDSKETPPQKEKEQPTVAIQQKQTLTSVEPTLPLIEKTVFQKPTNSSTTYLNGSKKEIIDTLKATTSKEPLPIQYIAEKSDSLPKKTFSATEKSIPEKKEPCNLELVNAVIHTTKGCLGTNENSIEIGKITGLATPTKSEIINDLNQSVTSNLELSDGNYTVIVSGSDGCKKEYPITLKSKNCPLNVDFNPNLGETWEIPLSTSAGVLVIYTKTGQEIVQKTLPANEISYWNGENRTSEIQTGYFIFTITYEDGSYLKGGITVTR